MGIGIGEFFGSVGETVAGFVKSLPETVGKIYTTRIQNDQLQRQYELDVEKIKYQEAQQTAANIAAAQEGLKQQQNFETTKTILEWSFLAIVGLGILKIILKSLRSVG